MQKRALPCCCALGLTRRALCGSAPRRAVLLWLAQRPAEAHAAVLLGSRRHGRSAEAETHAAVLLRSGCHGALWRRPRVAVLWLHRADEARAAWKRTTPCCFALADAAPGKSVRRRAVAPWLTLRRARCLAKAVFLIHRKEGGLRLACAGGGLGAP